MERQDHYQRISDAHAEGLTAYVLQLCLEFLRSYPDHGPAWCVKGIVLAELARYDEAEEALKKAQKLSPNDGIQTVLSQFGHLEQARGNLSKAREWFKKAHDADPDDATYLIFIGSTFFREGNLQEAEQTHLMATQCSDGYIDEAYFNLGGVYLAREQFEKAKECYQKALEIDPEYEMAQKRLTDVEQVLKYIP
jgi:tetratricopeptide (TPR) repeat protein